MIDSWNNTISVCVLASGSKGNAVYISDGETAVLIDAGLSGVEIERRLDSRGIRLDTLQAILVTHEHADHVKGVGILSRRYKLPVYINPMTYKAAETFLGKIADLRSFDCGHDFYIDTLQIHPFSVSHDAADTVGFTFCREHIKIGYATDLGIATAVVKNHLKKCNALILEANHDPRMLMTGPYPWPLKQRVKGRLGHLSNEDSCNLLNELQHDNLSHVVLAHLSEINNTPQKAYDTVTKAITRCAPRFIMANQYESTEVVIVK